MNPHSAPSRPSADEIADDDPALKIGLVEDNDDLRESILELLDRRGHTPVGFGCAEDIDDVPASELYDLFLVDLNLPGEDGLSLVTRLKRAQPGLRVIMMTSRTLLRDRVRGYDAGADIYLPKPVEEAELLAAIRAVSRQLRAEAQKASAEEGALQLDARTAKLRGRRGEVQLNADEVAILVALARASAQRLEYWQLIERVGVDVNDEAGKGKLAVKVTRLRGKLMQVGCPSASLRAVRGSGYQLLAAIEVR